MWCHSISPHSLFPLPIQIIRYQRNLYSLPYHDHKRENQRGTQQ